MRDRNSRPDRPSQEARSERAPRLTDDDLYRALASAERRRLLSILLTEESSTVDALATMLARDASEPLTLSDERERVRIELVHVHLPRLAEAGLVSFDRTRGDVTLEPLPEPVREVVRRSVNAEPPSRPNDERRN